MRLYPTARRTGSVRGEVTDEVKRISKQFGQEYFDGDRQYGYGGYSYHPRFWTDTVQLFRDHYQLDDGASILDVGCAKGFMLYDFQLLMPEAHLEGLDVSGYAIEHCKEEVKDCLREGNAKSLPWDDNSFDLVLSINTLHNLPREECMQAVREIERVSKRYSFIMVDGWKNDEEKALLLDWVLTPETMLHVDDWKAFFAEAGYTGDYIFWTTES